MHKVNFTGYIEIDELPDDRGSIDNWLGRAIADAVKKGNRSETGLEHLRILHIKWDLDVCQTCRGRDGKHSSLCGELGYG